MATTTLTPPQGLFNDDPVLHYPGACDIAGQVVGPNWLGEFYVIRETSYDGETTTAMLALLTKDRKDLLTVEARRGFVARVAQQKESEAKNGFQELPSMKELRNAEKFLRRPHLWVQDVPA